MKKCPECLNQVVDAAIACKYCGCIFNDSPDPELINKPSSENNNHPESQNKPEKKMSFALPIAVIFIGILIITYLIATQKPTTVIVPTSTHGLTFDIPATLTSLAIPTKKPVPTRTKAPTKIPTKDTRSNYEKCASAGYAITYLLSGSAGWANITWVNNFNGTEQGEYDIPFCYAYDGFTTGDFVYISAQIGSDNGDVTCQILHNGKVIARSHANGFANIASCSTSVP